MNAVQTSIFQKAMNSVAASVGRPRLFGANGRPLPRSHPIQYKRTASKRDGSLKNWTPSRLSRSLEIMDRERIVERAVDLTNSDPHAAGIVDTFATTVVGSGLTPHLSIDADALGLDREEAQRIQAEQRLIYQTWAPFADAGGRLPFGGVQFLMERSLLQFGEYLVLLPMLKDETRPYSLACQIIHPMRLKTPTDLASDSSIYDGVELGPYGEPVAYWIKKADPDGRLSDVSKNFVRVRTKRAHRWKVLHGFTVQDPEQVRGYPFFAPAMKFFRDLNDYLDAELVSNIVTAAYAVFIESQSGIDSELIAARMAGIEESATNEDGSSRTDRYEELDPGLIMYGNPGEKPHMIAANRPGATFEPFTKVIKKAIASAINIPYVVAFKDVEGTNFAGFRSAMLDAWRVFMTRRDRLGGASQKIYTMLMEEGYLRRELKVNDFYSRMHTITRVDWRGSPKGDIEPIKAVRADIEAIKANLKTREEAIAERGGDFRTTFDKLEEENRLLDEKGLNASASLPGAEGDEPDPDEGEGQKNE